MVPVPRNSEQPPLLPRAPFRHPKMYLCTIPRGKVFSKRDIFGDYATEYDVPFADEPDEPWNIELSEPASSRPSATISNSNKNRFSNMCEEYQGVFSSMVDFEPTRLPPYVFTIDGSKWKKPKNHGAVRHHSFKDNQQIHEQLEATNKLGVTTRIHARFYS